MFKAFFVTFLMLAFAQAEERAAEVTGVGKDKEFCYRSAVQDMENLRFVAVERLNPTLVVRYRPSSQRREPFSVKLSGFTTRPYTLDPRNIEKLKEKNGEVNFAYKFALPEVVHEQQSWLLEIKYLEAGELIRKGVNFRVFPVGAQLRIMNTALSCQKSLKPHLVSELYDNFSGQTPKQIEYNVDLNKGFDGLKVGEWGLIGLTAAQSWKFGSCDTNTLIPYGFVSFSTEKEVREGVESLSETSMHFTLPKGTSGFVVRQDTEEWIPTRRVGFNECGALAYDSKDIEWMKKTNSSFSFIYFEPNLSNVDEYLKSQMNQFSMFNSCKEN